MLKELIMPIGLCVSQQEVELTTTHVFDSCDKNEYTTYGICIRGKDGEILYRVEDICTRKDLVEEFITRCTTHEARLIHVPDLLEDYLLECEERHV